MGLLDLLIASSIPVLKVLLITAIGSYLALDHVDVLGEDARKHVNNVSCCWRLNLICLPRQLPRIQTQLRTVESLTTFFVCLCEQVVFYVFNPALVSSNLAETITYDSMKKMWVIFMWLICVISYAVQCSIVAADFNNIWLNIQVVHAIQYSHHICHWFLAWLVCCPIHQTSLTPAWPHRGLLCRR